MFTFVDCNKLCMRLCLLSMHDRFVYYGCLNIWAEICTDHRPAEESCMHDVHGKYHNVDGSNSTFRKLISLTFDQHQQNNQQVPAGILAFICHKLSFPVCGHETPQHIELAASSIILCIAQSVAASVWLGHKQCHTTSHPHRQKEMLTQLCHEAYGNDNLEVATMLA